LWATDLNMIVRWKLLTRWLITQDTDFCSTENEKCVSFIAVLDTTSVMRCLVMADLKLSCSVPQ